MYKIAILGPESTGKSELAKALAEYYHAEWVPEYAREYIEKLSLPYTYDDVCAIAKKQIAQEEFYQNNIACDFVFFDTDLIITKVWFEYCYHRVPEFVLQKLADNYFDFYLLCFPDVAWQPDPVREHGNDREYFFDWYKHEIQKTGKPFFVVTGTGEQRTVNAINAINSMLKV